MADPHPLSQLLLHLPVLVDLVEAASPARVERLLTEPALERLGLCVLVHVALQAMLVGKALGADGAVVGLFRIRPMELCEERKKEPIWICDFYIFHVGLTNLVNLKSAPTTEGLSARLTRVPGEVPVHAGLPGAGLLVLIPLLFGFKAVLLRRNPVISAIR